MNYRLLFLIAFILYGCSPRVVTKIRNTSFAPLNIDAEVFIFGLDEQIPLKSDFIGGIKVGEAGMTVKCGYDDMIQECIRTARRSGANIIELTKVKAPNFFSSCYRIEANIYRNETKEFLEGEVVEIDYTPREEAVISMLEGLKQGENTFFDIDGYDILLYESSKPFNDKTIKSLKSKFKIEKENLGKFSRKIKNNNVYFTSLYQEDNIRGFKDTYIFSNDKGNTSLVELYSTLERNDTIESAFLKMLTNLEIPSYIYTPWEVDSIYFANRYIKLGPVCEWQNIRNIQCPHLGQMDWSEFTSRERAEEYLRQRIEITREKNLSDFISQEEVPIIFEGVHTTAQKFALKINVPKIILGGSNIIYIYYVVAQIDNKYIGCVLSHYDNDTNSPNLPPLLSEVMQMEKD